MKSCIALIVPIVLVFNSLRAQEDIYHPIFFVFSTRPVPTWDFSGSIGGALTLLPKPLTEYPTPAPAFELRARLGLPLNIMAYGRAGSNIATTIVQSGLSWSYVIENFSVGVGWSAAYMYGNLTFVDGFNTSQHRWLTYPMLTGTAQFDKVIFTARIEAELMTSITKRIETQTVQSEANVYNGSSITLAVEQPFWKNTHVLLGATVSLTTNPYQSWFLYDTFRDRLLTTEFFMGFVL
ncbi:MAG: hypothetical protein SGJ05_05615 [bacterium]|nr:hypothetical protein [bacterium]